MAIIALLAVLPFFSGCSTTGSSLVSEEKPVSFDLNQKDQDFAQALSAFAKGKILEETTGYVDSKTTDFFLKASDKDPDNYELLKKAVVGLLYRKEWEAAHKRLLTFLAHHPDHLTALIDTAELCLMTGKRDDSIVYYEKAIKLAPDEPSLRLSLARILAGKDKVSALLKHLGKGTEYPAMKVLMADFAILHGARLLRDKKKDDAIKLFEFALANSESERSRIALVLAEISEEDKQEDKMRKYLLMATETTNSMPEAYVKLGLMDADTKPAEALAILRKGLEVFPTDTAIATAIGFVLNIQQDYVGAMNVMSRVFDKTGGKTPLPRYFYINYGSACERSGKLEKSEMVFEECIRFYPDAHDAMNYVAYMWADKNTNLDKALQYITTALQMAPDNAAYMDTLGWIYFRQGKLAKAREETLKALEKMPDDSTILEHLGDIEAASGNTAEARKYWSRSLEIDPNNESLKKKLADPASNTGKTEKTP